MYENNLLFFYYNFDSTTLFSLGGETIMGQSKYPEILNDRIDEYMYPYTPRGVLVMCNLPNFVLGRYGIVLDVRY